MSLTSFEFSKEIYEVVKENLDKITIVEQLLNLPNCVVNDEKFNHLEFDESECYTHMYIYKKKAQLSLNLYKTFDEYKSCKVLNKYEDFELILKLSEDSIAVTSMPKVECYLIEMLCNYVKYYFAIQAYEKSHKTIIFDDKYDSLFRSICFYCDHRFESNRKDCTMCGACTSDMKEYINNHMYSLKRQKNVNQKCVEKFPKISEIKEEDKFLKDSNDEKEWICDKCSFVNSKSIITCEACFSAPMDIYSYKNGAISWPIEKAPEIQFSFCNKKPNKSEIIIPNKFYFVELNPKEKNMKLEIVPTRKSSNYSDFWECSKCSLINKSGFCEACLNPSPVINKWKCERCGCINKYFNSKCSQCKYSNKNIINCLRCKKAKIPLERELCDKCFSIGSSWQCWHSKCSQINDGFSEFCKKCGLEKVKNVKCKRKVKETVMQVWICETCSAINDDNVVTCKNKKCVYKLNNSQNFAPHISVSLA